MFFIKTSFYGTKNRVVRDKQEEYDSTRWFCIFFLPLIPLGSFRVQRPVRKDVFARIARELYSRDTIYYTRRELDFEQIGLIYACVYGWYLALLALALTNDLIRSLPKK